MIHTLFKIMPKINNLFCEFCKKNYSRAYNFKIHMKNFHPTIFAESDFNQKNRSRFDQRCPLCDYSTTIRSNIEKHLRDEHKIEEVSCKILYFYNSNEFSSWKENLEKTTNTIFIKPCGTQRSKNLKTTYYYCSRSGYFTPKGEGKRALRMQGSSKINGVCPAKIKKIEKENEGIEVHYIDTHLGHDNDPHHLRLRKEERDEIARKIAQNISFDSILQEIRQSTEIGEKIERLKLLTKKDLWNIKYSFTNHNSLSHSSKCFSNDSENSNVIEIFEDTISKNNISEIEFEIKSDEFVLKCKELEERKNKLLENFSNILNQITNPEHIDIIECKLKLLISEFSKFQ